jgi:hypothetical protein
MKIVSNNKMIKRNTKIGQYATIGSLVILLAGLGMSFQPTLINYSFIALLLGFVISQVGIFYGNRFGRSPRPDERLTNALKGLDDKYTLYHFMTPVSHLLIGPAGVWVLQPYQQRGTISYDEQKNRWVQKGGNLYLKIFAQESLGRPDLDVKTSKLDIENYIKQQAENFEMPLVQSALVFTNPKAEIDAGNAPSATVTIEKLKDLIRRKAKEEPAPLEQVRLLQKIFPVDSID